VNLMSTPTHHASVSAGAMKNTAKRKPNSTSAASSATIASSPDGDKSRSIRPA